VEMGLLVGRMPDVTMDYLLDEGTHAAHEKDTIHHWKIYCCSIMILKLFYSTSLISFSGMPKSGELMASK